MSPTASTTPTPDSTSTPASTPIAGIEALQFLRTRKGVGDGSDLGRISNQQQYMSRLARKLVSEEVLTNPTTLLKLARTAIENVDPSTSLTNPLTLVQIALALKNVPFEEIVFVQYPTLTDPDNANHVVPNYDAADALWAALAANQPLQLTGEAGVNDGVTVVEPTTPPVEPTTPTDRADARRHGDAGADRDGDRAAAGDLRLDRRAGDLLERQRALIGARCGGSPGRSLRPRRAVSIAWRIRSFAGRMPGDVA